MNELGKSVEEMIEGIRAEIEERAKGLIYIPAQMFPLTLKFDDGNEIITATYHKPDNEGNISVDVTREIKTIEITVKLDKS